LDQAIDDRYSRVGCARRPPEAACRCDFEYANKDSVNDKHWARRQSDHLLAAKQQACKSAVPPTTQDDEARLATLCICQNLFGSIADENLDRDILSASRNRPITHLRQAIAHALDCKRDRRFLDVLYVGKRFDVTGDR
jgi:hypothetical protein